MQKQKQVHMGILEFQTFFESKCSFALQLEVKMFDVSYLQWVLCNFKTTPKSPNPSLVKSRCLPMVRDPIKFEYFSSLIIPSTICSKVVVMTWRNLKGAWSNLVEVTFMSYNCVQEIPFHSHKDLSCR